ncbi:TATA box-binding protein-associated factor RNA polymerase I subunit B-like [Glandiceps talaboti]
MVVCSVCQSEDDFYLQDGFYICNICDTQSQIRDIQQESDFVKIDKSNVFSMRIRKLTASTGRKAGRRKKEVIKSKPWLTYEAYQCILKEQVKSLIQMGVSPQLEVTVQQLWFQYLKMLNVAFTGKTTDLDDFINLSVLRKRDRIILTKLDSEMSPKKKKKDESRISFSFLSQEYIPDNTPGDNRLPVESGDDDCDDDDDQSESVSEAGTISSLGASSSSTQHSSYGVDTPITTMTMNMTICFLYLALIWLGEPILLSDLIRWVSEGHIPFFSAWKLLPKHMRLSSTDRLLLCPKAMSNNSKIRFKVGRLAEFIQLEHFPPVDVSKIVPRLILELHLPAELNGYVKNLIEKSNTCKEFTVGSSNQQKSAEFYEGIAVGFIIVAVKMMFGLDDVIEHGISQCAVMLQAVKNTDLKIFIWDDWVTFIKKREMGQSRKTEFPSDVSNMYNLNPYLKHHEEVTSKSKRNYGQESQKAKRYKDITMQKLQEPFQFLHSKVEEQDETWRSAPTSFCHEKANEEDTQTPELRQAIKNTARDFSSLSLEYVTDTQGFLDKYQIRKKRCVRKKKEEINTAEYLDRKIQNDLTGVTIEELHKLTSCHKRYIIYQDFKMGVSTKQASGFSNEQEEFHCSYDWLLGVCANLVESSKDELHSQVIKVELMAGLHRTKNKI